MLNLNPEERRVFYNLAFEQHVGDSTLMNALMHITHATYIKLHANAENK